MNVDISNQIPQNKDIAIEQKNSVNVLMNPSLQEGEKPQGQDNDMKKAEENSQEIKYKEENNPISKEENQDEVNLQTANILSDQENKGNPDHLLDYLDNINLQEESEKEHWTNETIVQPCNEFKSMFCIQSEQNENFPDKEQVPLKNAIQAKTTTFRTDNKQEGINDERLNFIDIKNDLVFPANSAKIGKKEMVGKSEFSKNNFRISKPNSNFRLNPLLHDRDLKADDTDYFFHLFNNLCNRNTRIKFLSDKIYKASKKSQNMYTEGSATFNFSKGSIIGNENFMSDQSKIFSSNFFNSSKFQKNAPSNIKFDLRFHNRNFNLKVPKDKELYIQTIKQELRDFSLKKTESRQNRDDPFMNFDVKLNALFPQREILHSDRPVNHSQMDLQKDKKIIYDNRNNLQESPSNREGEPIMKENLEKEINTEEVVVQNEIEKSVENIIGKNNS